MTDGAFETVTPPRPGRLPILFVCDHASNALPEAFGDLGLGGERLSTHIGHDIGAAHLTRALAQALGAPAILARWSRLLIDLNRGEDDPTLMMKLSDGSVIPGNAAADAVEIARRLRLFHVPYHNAIACEIANLQLEGRTPVLISMHSFTPSWKGKQRRWEVGVLWDRDARLAAPLIEALTDAGFAV